MGANSLPSVSKAVIEKLKSLRKLSKITDIFQEQLLTFPKNITQKPTNRTNYDQIIYKYSLIFSKNVTQKPTNRTK